MYAFSLHVFLVLFDFGMLALNVGRDGRVQSSSSNHQFQALPSHILATPSHNQLPISSISSQYSQGHHDIPRIIMI
jgi:hypothetical protein